MVGMLIFDHPIVVENAVLVTGAYDGHLFIKIHERLEHRFIAIQTGESGFYIACCFDARLAFAVIAKTRSL